MDHGPYIIATIALIEATACLVWLLAKHFSSHVIQYVDVNEEVKKKKGSNIFEQFAEIGTKGVATDIGDD